MRFKLLSICSKTAWYNFKILKRLKDFVKNLKKVEWKRNGQTVCF